MTGRRLVTPTVALGEGRWTCAACDADLGPASAPWKDGAIRRETPLAVAGPAWDTGDDSVVLRHSICPGCARLLDTETAMAGDPPLVDRIG